MLRVAVLWTAVTAWLAAATAAAQLVRGIESASQRRGLARHGVRLRIEEDAVVPSFAGRRQKRLRTTGAKRDLCRSHGVWKHVELRQPKTIQSEIAGTT